MDRFESTSTAWGAGAGDDVDVRALRRYNRILAVLLDIGEWACLALLPCVAIAAIWLVTQTNFENVVFYDGTDSICIYDGTTGEIRNVE
ncbi:MULTISPECIES: hypothetical protein [Pseudomonas]|uniref:hypothetical protein n=1 Tax=Pseudomonas TaxID=286 RepID=UPI0004155856|nr:MULTISPECIES: hypothetical protein [Pseudomonas]MBK4987462.1 hypothetical protein [Pseudomonas sp. S36]